MLRVVVVDSPEHAGRLAGDAVAAVVGRVQRPVLGLATGSSPRPVYDELARRFAARAGAVDGQPGFESFELLRPVAGENRYFVVTQWESEEAFQAWASGPAVEAHAGQRAKPVATGASLLEFEVVLDVQRTDGAS